jgi:pimeloyl-ACP methyl ester carboxylesterase
MATFVLIPGAGSTAWYWHLVEPELRALGHDVLAVTLPVDDDAAGLAEYTATVVAAIDDRPRPTDDDLVLVAQSMGGFTAPLVADRVPVAMIILVAAMVPAPGESPGEWWTNTGHAEALHEAAVAGGWEADEEDPGALFLHDVPADVIAGSEAHLRNQSGTPFEKPWPLHAWPDVSTRFLLCRDDRFFPAEFQRRIVRERLGFDPDEMDSGHLPALAHPVELAARLDAYWSER